MNSFETLKQYFQNWALWLFVTFTFADWNYVEEYFLIALQLQDEDNRSVLFEQPLCSWESEKALARGGDA